MRPIETLGLPPLPPMPGRERHTIEHVPSDAHRLAEDRCERSKPPIEHGGSAYFLCAHCEARTPWWDGTWGRWQTGEKRPVLTRDSTTRRMRLVFVPATVAGRTCAPCTHTLKRNAEHKPTAEPDVTMTKEKR